MRESSSSSHIYSLTDIPQQPLTHTYHDKFITLTLKSHLNFLFYLLLQPYDEKFLEPFASSHNHDLVLGDVEA